MNRIPIVLVLVLSLLTSGAMAAHAATCQLGVKGGISIEEIYGDGDSTGDRKGFVGGAFALVDFSQNFGLRFEGLYFMKGAHEEEGGNEVTLKLDYFEIPILAVAHVPISESARLDFFGGPTVGFNVQSEIEFKLLGLAASEDIDGLNTVEAGVTFGVGVGFDVGSVVIGVDGRYGIGLTNISDDGDGKNRGFAAMASIGFPVGQK